MKLDRNDNPNGYPGHGKYALLLLRQLDNFRAGGTFGGELPPELDAAVKTLEKFGVLDLGIVGTESEFFLIRLKDKYANCALTCYANAASRDGAEEWAGEVLELASRSGVRSQWCKRPD